MILGNTFAGRKQIEGKVVPVLNNVPCHEDKSCT